MLHLLAVVTLTSRPQNLLWISGAVGVFLPFICAIINQSHWPSGLKSVLVAAAALTAGAVVCWSKGQVDFSNILTSAGVIWTFTVTTYHGLWKPTSIITALEAATTVRRTVPPTTKAP